MVVCRFRIILSLFVLMGVSWLMEVISFAVGGLSYFWIPSDILNILTPVFIFVIFVCKRKIWLLLKQKCSPLERVEKLVTGSGRQFRDSKKQETQHETSSSAMSLKYHPAAAAAFNARRKNSAPVTQSTQMFDSSQVESGDETTEIKLNSAS